MKNEFCLLTKSNKFSYWNRNKTNSWTPQIVKKQLSPTFLLVRLNKERIDFPYKAWFENVSKWKPEERSYWRTETTTFAIEYMKQDKPVKITIDKENLDLIISMEMARVIWENTTYTGRFLNFITNMPENTVILTAKIAK